jgi:CheY-like chemotaxis protein
VVSAILECNGFDVVLARDGREGMQALRTSARIDLVLLDFVMPRMNGYQFCRELRADGDLKQTPVVLMSARTNAIGDRFVEQTGAIDALSKPFDARALVTVVESVLAKRAEKGDQLLPPPEAMDDEESLIQPPVESLGPPSKHLRTLGGVVVKIAQAIAPHVRRLRPQDIHGKALEDAVAVGLEGDALLEVIASLGSLDLIDAREVMRGSCAKLPLADLLQMLQLRRQSGVMNVTYKDKSMEMFLRDGMLEFARGRDLGDEFRIGRYFVQKGWIGRERLEALVANKPDGRLLGEWLVEQGQLDADKLSRALALQTAELVYECLRWPDGRFTLSDAPLPPEADRADLGLGMSELVLEGFRRVDEWRLMADTIDFNAVLLVDSVALGTLDDSKIADAERAVLFAIDGKRSVREVMEATHLASFDAVKAIYGFLQSRIVRDLKPKTARDKSDPPEREKDELAEESKDERLEGSKPSSEGLRDEGDKSGDDHDKPASSKPASSKPASSKPASSKPASSKPASDKPDSEKPASEKTEDDKPEEDKSEDDKSEEDKAAPPKSEEERKDGAEEPEKDAATGA